MQYEGISFGLWFYFGIEELPLAVEETIEPEKNMPRGLAASMITLIIVSFCTAIFSSVIEPGAQSTFQSTAPLVIDYQSVFGDTTTTSWFTWITVIGIISSTHSFVYYMGRLLFAIARDGYLPQFLTKAHPTCGSAYAALTTGGIVNQTLAVVLRYTVGYARLGPVLMNLALFGALISYTFQLTSSIMLRIKEPNRSRPYRNPFGIPGAVVCMLLCAVSLFAIIYSGTSSTDFLVAVVTAAILFAVGTIYFFVSVQPRLASGAVSGAASPAVMKIMHQNLLSPQSNNRA